MTLCAGMMQLRVGGVWWMCGDTLDLHCTYQLISVEQPPFLTFEPRQWMSHLWPVCIQCIYAHTLYKPCSSLSTNSDGQYAATTAIKIQWSFNLIACLTHTHLVHLDPHCLWMVSVPRWSERTQAHPGERLLASQENILNARSPDPPHWQVCGRLHL